MKRLVLLPLLALAACAGDTVDDPGSVTKWKTVTDSGTGVVLRCFENEDTNSHGYAITCYRLEEGEYQEKVVTLTP